MCFFLISLHFFTLFVSGTFDEPSGYVTANGLRLRMLSPAPSSFTHCFYYFYDGQPTTFSCCKTTGDLVRIMYANQDVQYDTGFHSGESVDLYIRLSNSYNKSYIECHIVTQAQQTNNKTIIQVVLMNSLFNTAKLGFKVNGLIHLPRVMRLPNGKMKYEIQYQYQYYKNEELTIETLLQEDFVSRNLLYCWSKDTPYQLDGEALRIRPYQKVTFNSSTSKPEIGCSVTYQNTLQSLCIRFLSSDEDKSSLYVIGLSFAHTLVKYKKDSGTDVIVYESYNDSLIINVRYKSQFKELKENEGFFCAPEYSILYSSYSRGCVISRLNNENRSKVEFSLSDNYSWPSNKHVYSIEVIWKRVVETITTLRPIHIVQQIETAVSPQYKLAENQSSSANNDRDDNLDTVNNITLFIVKGVIVLLIIVTIVIWILWRFKKWRKLQNTDIQQIEMDYHPPNNEGPKPMPPQRNYRPINNKISRGNQNNFCDRLYAKCIPKSQRAKLEPMYDQVADAVMNQSEPTYAEVGSHSKVPIYDNVRPCTEPTPVNVKGCGPETVYAEIEFKTAANHCGSQNIRSFDTTMYATIVPPTPDSVKGISKNQEENDYVNCGENRNKP